MTPLFDRRPPFLNEVRIEGILIACGICSSKRGSRHDAARRALQILCPHLPLPNVGFPTPPYGPYPPPPPLNLPLGGGHGWRQNSLLAFQALPLCHTQRYVTHAQPCFSRCDTHSHPCFPRCRHPVFPYMSPYPLHPTSTNRLGRRLGSRLGCRLGSRLGSRLGWRGGWRAG